MSITEQFVRAVYPGARCEFWADPWDDGFVVIADGRDIGVGSTSAEAWERAKKAIDWKRRLAILRDSGSEEHPRRRAL
jgi:hypothetical protein